MKVMPLTGRGNGAHSFRAPSALSRQAGSVPFSLHLAAAAKPMSLQSAAAMPLAEAAKPENETRRVFGQFVGETMYGLTLQSMRKTQQNPAYCYGGRGEEVFRQRLDQVLAEKLGASSADKFAGSMFELSQLSRY